MDQPQGHPSKPNKPGGASNAAQDESVYLTKIALISEPSPPADSVHPPNTRLSDENPSEGQISPQKTERRGRNQVQTPQVLILGFALIILIGTVLLQLPWSSATGESIGWLEALFTATSATTVTGLIVVNTANDFSLMGQIIILVLIQIGGVGFVAFSVLLLRLIGRRVTLNERFIVQQTLAARRMGGVVQLTFFVLGVTLFFEAIGTLLLWLRWRSELPDDLAFWYALFHAISSYCNAGFDLFGGTEYEALFGFGADYFTLGVMATLIVLGGFGVTVLYDLTTYARNRALSLHTRITLLLSITLTVVGTGIMIFDPTIYQTVLSHLSLGEQFAVTLFTVISARTAGLTILPIEELSQSTQLILMLWMFIGGAPASMAGGVSTSTVGVLIFAVVATAKGYQAAVAFGRTLPTETIAKAVAIMTVSTLVVATVTLGLTMLSDVDIFRIGFEAVSAFTNTGYSLGHTGELDTTGRLLIILSMFWGRLGPLTIVVALAESEVPSLVGYPEEPVILG
jgi:trk system potassium uptake protein